MTVSLTVPDDTEEETAVLEELAAGLLEEIGACEDETAGALATTSSESSVRNASAAPPGRMNPAAASAASPACSSGRRAAVQNTATAASAAEQNIRPYCRQFFMFCIPPPFNRLALLLKRKTVAVLLNVYAGPWEYRPAEKGYLKKCKLEKKGEWA